MTTTTDRATARSPEQVCDLFMEYATAGDAEGLASLYEPAAQLVLPSGREARGPGQLRAACAELCFRQAAYAVRTDTIHRNGELSLITRTWTITTTAGATAGTRSPLVVRLQADGRWLAVIDDLSAGAS